MGKTDYLCNRCWYWICPYFKYDGHFSISCDVGFPSFPNDMVCERYMRKYCASYEWKKCTLAQAMTEFQEEEDVRKQKKCKNV